MNLNRRTLTAFVMVTLTIALFSLPLATSAHDDDSNCKKAKGNLSVLNNGNGTTSGTITQGGRLNGSTQEVFTSGFTPTPDPSTFSYTGNFSITMNKGVLRSSNVGIFDVGTGLFSEIARIDPTTSTGDFAGATGVLYINGKTTDGGATFTAEITGEYCLAE